MKVIIIILQAILNLVRKRRDLIANRSKIPPEYRDDVVVFEFYTGKVDELANQNALIMIFRPFIDKAADKSIGKVDKFLKMI